MEMINQDELARMQMEAMKKQLLSRMLTKEAFERLGRVRSVNPNLASQAEMYLLQIYQAGKLKESVSDGQMKQVLQALSEGQPFSIKRK